MKTLVEVASSIKPSKQEEKELQGAIQAAIRKISSGLNNAKVILGGSAAKGSWLAGIFDIDLFVQFDYLKSRDKDISKILKKHLKKKFKRIETVHGSRDYFKTKQGKFIFEIVPVLKITKTEQAENIMDISPLHVAWVRKKINSKLSDEVRLMKAFCRAQNVYGAESYIRGFSGYACEVLTLHYGSFLKLISAAAKWKGQQVIDPERYFRGKDALRELNKSKTYGPLILIDPVQAERNITTALNKEKFDIFIKAARQFLKTPSRILFEKRIITIEGLKKKAKGKKLVIIDVVAAKGKEDIIGAKLLKALEFLNTNLATREFKVYDYGWVWDMKKAAIFWFILDSKELSNQVVVIGPPVKIKEHAKKFRKAHRKVFVKKANLCATEKRQFTKPEKFIAYLIKDPYFKERVRKAKCLCYK